VLKIHQKGGIDMSYILTKSDCDKLDQLITEAKDRTNQAALDGYTSGAEQDGHHDECYQLSLRETALHNRRLKELEEIRNQATVINPEEQSERVQLGNIVQLQYEDDRLLEIIICGYSFTSSEKRERQEISIKSPMGRAILGAQIGDTRQMHVKGKTITVKIVDILPPSCA
jgi:transcription elongation GreA/GreB family factor